MIKLINCKKAMVMTKQLHDTFCGYLIFKIKKQEVKLSK